MTTAVVPLTLENNCSELELEDDENDSTSSVATNEALLDMLGLTEGFPSALEEDPILIEHEVSRIALPRNCSRYGLPPTSCAAFLINNIFNASECQELISLGNQSGFRYITQASHIDNDGRTLTVDIANPNPHKLAVFENPRIISRLWNILHKFLSRKDNPIRVFMERTGCGPPLGLNPRLRVLRYDSKDDDRFEPHFDATTVVGNKKSLLTVLLYLNEGGVDFEGGETLYLEQHNSTSACIDSAAKITPKTGQVVIFEHDLFHSSSPLLWGTKYVMRTDILFADTKDQREKNVDDRHYGNVPQQSSRSTVDTVSDLCSQIEMSAEYIGILRTMDLLDITVDSFVAPGITLLKAMLEDAGIDTYSAELLVHTAFSAIGS